MPDEQKPRFMRREKWIELPGEEYAGHSIRIWVNPPARIWNLIMGGRNSSEIEEGLTQVILEHNGWTDFDGNPLPAPTDTEFWREIPTELAGLIIQEAQAEANRLPSSLAPRRKRS